MPLQGPQAGVAGEAPLVPLADARPEQLGELARDLGLALGGGRRPEQLGGHHAGHLVDDLGGAEVRHLEAPRGEVDPGQAGPVPVAVQARQVVVHAPVEGVLLGDRPRGHDAHDAALDDALGLARIGELLADGDAEALVHQAHEVALDRAHRHAGHGHGVDPLGAGGQGDPQLLGRHLGVLSEQLVEVAHAEEQEGVRLLLLGPPELLHHGRLTALAGSRAALGAPGARTGSGVLGHVDPGSVAQGPRGARPGADRLSPRARTSGARSRAPRSPAGCGPGP